MGELLPGDKEERVKEVDELGEEIPKKEEKIPRGAENCGQDIFFNALIEIQAL